jgi:hypothetical protein
MFAVGTAPRGEKHVMRWKQLLCSSANLADRRHSVPVRSTPVQCSASRFFVALSALIFLLVGFVRPSVAAIAYVQGTSANSSSSGSLSKAYASAQAAGDLNVVIVSWNDGTSTVSSVTDS